MKEFVLATTNPGKLREMHDLLEETQWRVRGLTDFDPVPEPFEDGHTFEANARIKALYYSEKLGLPALADDSGLEVDAINGAPGVISAIYAGQPRNDHANNAKLVSVLANVPQDRRTARYRCAMAFAVGGRVLLESSGSVEGQIIDTPHGYNGFGYDAHFLLPDRGQTMAELTPEDKNAISHRGQALREMLKLLRENNIG